MDPATVGVARLAFSVAAFVLAAAANMFAWWATRSKARRDDVDTQIKALNDRIQAIERDVHHSPSQGQIQELHSRIGEVHGDLQRMAGKLDGINRLADLMNEHLLKEGKRSS